MRRWTLITIVVLAIVLAVVAFLQLRAAQGPQRFPGPGLTPASPNS